jgi:hypothetical protein
VGQPQRDDLVSGHAIKTFALEVDLSAGRLDEAGDGPQGRCLACTVGADEADDLALADGETDPLDGFDLAVGDPQVTDLKHRAHA